MTGDELRDAIRHLPPIPGTSFWDGRRGELRAMILSESIDHFLRWPTVESTMFVGNAPYIATELKALPSAYIDAIFDPGIGSPVLYNNYTTGNLIHQAYHLSQWGMSVKNLRRIVEVGAGYGAMAMIINRLGFRGDYQIIDLPEFGLLQQYYLSQTVGDTGRLTWSGSPASCDLLIACHSLSEMPIAERDQILDDFPASSYLFVYHCEHEGVDNLTYFAEFAEGKPDHFWRQWATEHLPNQMYLVGVR